MTNFLTDLSLALPHLILLMTACVVLIISVIDHRKDNAMIWVATYLGLAAAFVVHLAQFNGSSVIFFNGQAVSDGLSQVMNPAILLSVGLSLVYSKHYMEEHQMPIADLLILSLFSTLGMMVLVCANTLLTSFLGLELISLPLYALTAARRTNGDSSEAAMKYFVMGAMASGLLLYGFSLLYGATGQFELPKIASALLEHRTQVQFMLMVSIVFILAGLGFKLALVPFHMWAPDVYQGAPLSVTLLLSTAPKLAGLALLIRLLTTALPSFSGEWQSMLFSMTLLSILLGNLFAVVQTNLRRLLAYSAIAHLGFALFGVLVANSTGYASALYYLLIYVFMTTASFGLLLLLSHNGIEIENVDDLKGLNQKNPLAAFLFMLVMFSLAGIPPTAGFFIKLSVLKVLVDAGMTWMAVVAVILAVIGAFYYLRIIKTMYFDEPELRQDMSLGGGRWVIGIYTLNCLALLYFGLFPAGLISLCTAVFMG